MASSSATPKSRSALALLSLAILTLVIIGARGGGVSRSLRSTARSVVAPVQGVADRVLSPVGNLFHSAGGYNDLKRENRELRAELARLKGVQLRVPDALRENRELRRLLGVINGNDLKFKVARVLGESPSNFEESIELDIGSSSGVRRFMPVATNDGLIGHVASVSRRRCRVTLITARGAALGVRLSASGDVGVTTGEGKGRSMPLDLIDASTPVTVGEPVVTSGLQDSRYPPGIVVGRVKSAVKVQTGDVYRQVTVAPVVDFDKLGFVKVILWGGTE